MTTVPKGVRGYYPEVAPEDQPRPVHVFTERLGPMVPLMSNSPTQWIASSGMMLRVLVGSGVHGTAIEGQDDRDEMGICVEPPQTVIGMRNFSHYEFRTQPDGVCSGPGDLDLIVYSLRRYASLAAKGNPTVLLPLFVPEEHVLFANDYGRELRENKELFLSKQVGARFKGYLHSQREGLMGLRSGGSRNQGRADIRARYGFDTKFATHMVRLGYQGVELLSTGNISLPLPTKSLIALQELRRGERTKDWALAEAERLEKRIDVLLDTTRLPDEPDWRAIDQWLVSVHTRYWGLA
jgi:hypothetical protein